MVEGGGFEPPKVEPADLQSAPFGRSGTPPNSFTFARRRDYSEPLSFMQPFSQDF
jgi:hypothetical protein